jgi:hypothetical protein
LVIPAEGGNLALPVPLFGQNEGMNDCGFGQNEGIDWEGGCGIEWDMHMQGSGNIDKPGQGRNLRFRMNFGPFNACSSE